MSSTRYVVIRSDGNAAPNQGLTLEDAAEALLTSDGYAYEIRTYSDGYHRLYVSDGSANSTRGARNMVVCPRHFAETREALLMLVVAGEWRGLEAVTDEEWTRRMAEADQEDEHGAAHEAQRDRVLAAAWETWTQNGLGLDEEERARTMDEALEAVDGAWAQGMDDARWLRATLAILPAAKQEG